MDSTEIDIHTGNDAGLFDITAEVAAFVTGKGDGLVSVFVPHATAGIALIETGAGSDHDLLNAVDRLLPRDDRLYRHRHGAVGHGADHVLPSFVSPSLTVPVFAGRLRLGTWQSVVLVDTNRDNADRRVVLSFIAG